MVVTALRQRDPLPAGGAAVLEELAVGVVAGVGAVDDGVDDAGGSVDDVERRSLSARARFRRTLDRTLRSSTFGQYTSPAAFVRRMRSVPESTSSSERSMATASIRSVAARSRTAMSGSSATAACSISWGGPQDGSHDSLRTHATRPGSRSARPGADRCVPGEVGRGSGPGKAGPDGEQAAPHLQGHPLRRPSQLVRHLTVGRASPCDQVQDSGSSRREAAYRRPHHIARPVHRHP